MNAPAPVFHVRIPAAPSRPQPAPAKAPNELQRVFARLAEAPKR